MVRASFFSFLFLLRVRVEIMGSQNCGIVEKSQSEFVMTNPIIFTPTRRSVLMQLAARRVPCIDGRRIVREACLMMLTQCFFRAQSFGRP
jgi:hypothetical protein